MSAASTSASGASFPSVGDIFPTINAFKQASSSAADDDDDGDERAAGGHAGRDSMPSRPQKRRRKSSLFPSAIELANEVDRLIEGSGGTVPLPSARDTFDSPDEFIAQCRAYAQTHGFSVGRRKSRAGWMQLRCFRSHSRYSSAPGGACGFRLEGEEGDHRLWRLSAQNLSHNHSLKSTPPLPAPRQALALAPPVAPAHVPVVTPMPAPSPSTAARPQLCPRAADDLTAFAHAAFPQLPASDTDSLVTFLRRAGIDTPAALAALPSLDIGILGHLDSELKRADASDGWSVVELAQALQGGMRVQLEADARN
ncbi:hypothetical protein JCM10450v2_002087 [Rhodotorula kratochvilovae]